MSSIPQEIAGAENEAQLKQVMGLDGGLAWRVDLMDGLIEQREIVRAEKDAANAAAKAARDKLEHIDRVLMQCIQQNGGRKVVGAPDSSYSCAYVSRRDTVMVQGHCKTHDGLHFPADDCVEHVPDPELRGVPEEFQRIKRELKKREAQAFLKDDNPLAPCGWGRIEKGAPFVVIRRRKDEDDAD